MRVVTGVIGAVIGFMAYGPPGAAMGWSIGYGVGSVLFPPAGPDIQGPRLSDLRVQDSTYGVPIAMVFGVASRLSGNVIWATPLIETKHTQRQGGGKGGGGGGSKVTTYTYSCNVAIGLCAGPIVGVNKIWADGKLIYDAPAGKTSLSQYFRLYLGNETQMPDPFIESHEGVGNTPAYRGLAYIVFQGFQLANFGNRIPMFSFEVVKNQTTLASVVTELCAKVGYSYSDLDVSTLTDSVEGYVVARRTTVRACLEPLAVAYNMDATESDHVIKFVKRGQSSVRTLTEEDLAAYDSGSEPPPLVGTERENDLELPVRVDVAYMRRESDYQHSTQSARRETAPGDGVTGVELPVVMSDIRARRVAETQLLEAWLSRQKVAWQTTRKHLDLDPCDIVTLPLADGWTDVRIVKKDESRNGLVKWEGTIYDVSAYTGIPVAVYGGRGAQELTGTPPGVMTPSTGLLLNLPALRDQDDEPGFYWAATGPEASDWPGAALMVSLDGGASYDQIASLTNQATIGTVATALGAGPTHVFDEKNTLTVTLIQGTLESVGRLAVYNGINAAMVGNEIIQFREATLTAANTYTLSGLLRGRRGTEAAVGTHQANESFLLLQNSGIVRILSSLSDIGTLRPFKTVTSGQNVSDAATTEFAPTAKALKPFSPVQLRGGRDADGNLSMAWRRRTRLAGELVDGLEVPLSEASEAYEVEIYSSSAYSTVVSTYTGLTSPSLVYSAADAIDDFGSVPAKVYVKVYQLSATVGRGDALIGAI